MPAFDPREFRAARRVRDRVAASHLYNPRVTLIDVGWKITDGQLTDKLTVRIHMRHKPKGPAFESFAARNPALIIPDEQTVGFPLDFIEADYQPHWHWYSTQQTSTRAGVYNPLRGGISISNEWDYGYGTLGGLVKDRETGHDMILSAWHVLASSAYSRPGLRIYQPGSGDGGQRRHAIAQLARHGMKAGIDAAVAELLDTRTIINDQLEVGRVTGETEPRLGMSVVKSGRASAVTYGMISGVAGEELIPYAGFQRKIRHVIHIVRSPKGGNVSQGGDSGSWWLEEKTRKAAGLHFAGADEPEYALAIAMPRVLEALNVYIPTEA